MSLQLLVMAPSPPDKKTPPTKEKGDSSDKENSDPTSRGPTPTRDEGLSSEGSLPCGVRRNKMSNKSITFNFLNPHTMGGVLALK